MRIGRLAVALACGAVVGCQIPATLTPAEQNVQRQIIEDKIDAWTQALNNREQSDVVAAYADGAETRTVWHDGTRASGKEEVGTSVEAFYNTIQYMNFVPQSPVVEILGANSAFATFRYSMDLRFNDTRRDVSAGNGLLVFSRAGEDSEWAIRAQVISPNP